MINSPLMSLIIKEALSCLEEDEKEAFIMRYQYQYSYIEIAEELGMSTCWLNGKRVVDRAYNKIQNFINGKNLKIEPQQLEFDFMKDMN